MKVAGTAPTAKRPRAERRRGSRRLLTAAGCALAVQGFVLQAFVLQGLARAQQTPGAAEAQAHYDEAFRLQDDGQISPADTEHKLFLGIALHAIANARANLGEYAGAVPIYDAALELNPDEITLHMDYAEAALDGFDWKKAETLAAGTVDLMRKQGMPPSPVALSVLAKAMMGRGEYRDALEQLKIVADIDPGFESSYALAAGYLALGDKPDAAKIFADIQEKYGDTAGLRMKLGRLYGQAAFYDDAFQEFRSAIDLDPTLAGVHFSLGATWMMRSGESSFRQAEPELRKELELYPDSPLALVALGRVQVVEHRYPEAEASLARAIELSPGSTAAYALLGELYSDLERDAEAEAAFRRQIDLTLVPAKNDFEVQRAHYLLGRLLLKEGKAAEGRRELDISKKLLALKARQVEAKLRGNARMDLQVDKTRQAGADELEAESRMETQVGRMVASSYDNLGVHAAVAGEYAAAAGYFSRAARWDPSIAGIGWKWGRAAYAAGEYADAVEPLSRALSAHPEDDEMRTMLGLSLFQTHDYVQTVRVLQLMEAKLDGNFPLKLAYVGSMAIAGGEGAGLGAGLGAGMAGLKELEKTHPESADIRRLMGEAYAAQKQYPQSARELRAALKLDPASKDAKHALALTDLALGDKQNARKLLLDLAAGGSNDADVLYRLGRLQIESGAVKAGVESLKNAVRMNPVNAAYHRELADAYRRNDQPNEAEDETRVLIDLEDQAVTPPQWDELLI